jgi:hypothetical protein
MWYATGIALIVWGVASPRDRSPDHFGGLTSGAAILLTLGLLFVFLGYALARLERGIRGE